MSASVTEVILNFFEKKGGLPGASLEEKLACRYLDQGVIDSMGIIDLISELEDTFSIRFDADQLQSEEFSTVAGVVKMVEELRQAS